MIPVDPQSTPADRAASYMAAATAAAARGDTDTQRKLLTLCAYSEAPDDPEAWVALAQYHYDHHEWPKCESAANNATRIESDRWAMWDMASAAAHAQSDYAAAAAYDYNAWVRNQTNERLWDNLVAHTELAPIATYAIIPKARGQRDEETAALVAQLKAQGATVWVDESKDPIFRKWNTGTKLAGMVAVAAGQEQWNVLHVNNDVVVGDDAVLLMAAALRSNASIGISHPAQHDGLFTNWCFMMRGEAAYEIDEDYEWWYAAEDLVKQVTEQSTDIIASCPAIAAHLHGDEVTKRHYRLYAAALQDEKRFADKWNIDPDTLFLATHPKWGPKQLPEGVNPEWNRETRRAAARNKNKVEMIKAKSPCSVCGRTEAASWAIDNDVTSSVAINGQTLKGSLCADCSHMVGGSPQQHLRSL